MYTYATHGQEQNQPSLSCLPSTCLCFRTSHFTLLSVPVLHHTSTPIVFCLSPPTTTHPVWEQAASLLQFARDFSLLKHPQALPHTVMPSSTRQRISHISEIDAYMFLLAACVCGGHVDRVMQLECRKALYRVSFEHTSEVPAIPGCYKFIKTEVFPPQLPSTRMLGASFASGWWTDLFLGLLRLLMHFNIFLSHSSTKQDSTDSQGQWSILQ